MTEHTDWLEYKALRDEPEQPVCPFCGIHHTPAKTHPYCNEVLFFRMWCERGKQRP